MTKRFTAKELKRLFDETMCCEVCGLPDEPDNPVEAHLIPDKGSRPHKLHAKNCKDNWLAHHPKKFFEGEKEKATVIRHYYHDGRTEETPVRQWRTTPELSWYSGQCVWIHALLPRCRTGSLVSGCCHDPGIPWYFTIEHEGTVLYDSRWDVPYDPDFERGSGNPFDAGGEPL